MSPEASKANALFFPIFKVCRISSTVIQVVLVGSLFMDTSLARLSTIEPSLALVGPWRLSLTTWVPGGFAEYRGVFRLISMLNYTDLSQIRSHLQKFLRFAGNLGPLIGGL